MSTLTGENLWEPGLTAIIGDARPGTRPRYERARVTRVTKAQIITSTGARFWKDLGVEVGSHRVILPPWAPSYPILEAQIVTADRVTAAVIAAVDFARTPGKETAQHVLDAVHDYLAAAA